MSTGEIVAVWDAYESSEPDISTERLLAMTSSTCGCDDGDVVDALVAEGRME